MTKKKYDEFKQYLPLKLNEQQEQAVQCVDGNCLLIAVPGSGKTSTLVARLGNLIYCHGIDPAKILTVTYTVAATQDMSRRFAKLFGEEVASKLEFKTINSICAAVIRKYGQMIGRQPFELESNEKVLLGIITSLYQKYEGEYPAESDVKAIKTYITYIKNMMLDEEGIEKLESEAGVQLANIYKDYCNELKSHRRMDFDDQMIYAYNLLKSSPQLLQYYREKYQYWCVDEAQDTSKIQHMIIELLASGNLFMVGDEDQSIYGFRAAYPQALLDFEKNHNNAKVLFMEDNFRSNAHIVAAADAFIQKNTLRHKKTMKATRPAGSKIKEIKTKLRDDQYHYLMNVAKTCTEQTAVLYRDNESAIPLIDMLEREKIPYNVRKAELAFFTNRVVLDVQSIMRFASNPDDMDLFNSIYYKLSTYLTKKQVLAAGQIMKVQGLSLFDSILSLDIKAHIQKTVQELEHDLEKLRNETPYNAINRIMYNMGYADYLKRANISDSKIQIMKAIAKKEKTIDGFLIRMAELQTIIETKGINENCQFILSTIHSSKGLEYDNVYIIDVIDGIFPESVPRDLRTAEPDVLATYEEERRLFYVGVTRAKDNLYVFKNGSKTTFVDQFIHQKYETDNVKMAVQNKAYRIAIPQKVEPSIVKKKSKVQKSSGGNIDEFTNKLVPGTKVKHKKFGSGKIVRIEDDKVKIQFGVEQRAFNIKLLCEHDLLSFK